MDDNMHKRYQYLFYLVTTTALVAMTSVYSDVPNTITNPTSSLAPIAAFNYTGDISPSFAYNLLGEGGAYHLRANGTLGFALYDYNRIKITTEYLAQDVTYSFFAGNSREWV